MERDEGHCLCGQVTYEFAATDQMGRPLPLRKLPAQHLLAPFTTWFGVPKKKRTASPERAG